MSGMATLECLRHWVLMTGDGSYSTPGLQHPGLLLRESGHWSYQCVAGTKVAGLGISKPHAINHQIGREHDNGATHSATTRNVRGVRGAPVYCVSDGQEIVLTSRRICWPFLLVAEQNPTTTKIRVDVVERAGKCCSAVCDQDVGRGLIICVEPSRRVERACRSVVSRKAENNSKPNATPGKLQQRWQQGSSTTPPRDGKGGRGRPAGGGLLKQTARIQGPIKQSSAVHCLHGDRYVPRTCFRVPLPRRPGHGR